MRKDGGSDGRGVGFYFRNVTELILFGVRGKNARTLAPGRSQVNMIQTRKREHSRKTDEQYELIESCSPGPFLELFGRGVRRGWTTWGDQANTDRYETTAIVGMQYDETRCFWNLICGGVLELRTVRHVRSAQRLKNQRYAMIPHQDRIQPNVRVAICE